MEGGGGAVRGRKRRRGEQRGDTTRCCPAPDLPLAPCICHDSSEITPNHPVAEDIVLL